MFTRQTYPLPQLVRPAVLKPWPMDQPLSADFFTMVSRINMLKNQEVSICILLGFHYVNYRDHHVKNDIVPHNMLISGVSHTYP